MFQVQALLFFKLKWTKKERNEKACRNRIHIQFEFEFEIKHFVYVAKTMYITLKLFNI